jgi:hypothetical protein
VKLVELALAEQRRRLALTDPVLKEAAISFDRVGSPYPAGVLTSRIQARSESGSLGMTALANGRYSVTERIRWPGAGQGGETAVVYPQVIDRVAWRLVELLSGQHDLLNYFAPINRAWFVRMIEEPTQEATSETVILWNVLASPRSFSS